MCKRNGFPPPPCLARACPTHALCRGELWSLRCSSQSLRSSVPLCACHSPHSICQDILLTLPSEHTEPEGFSGSALQPCRCEPSSLGSCDVLLTGPPSPQPVQPFSNLSQSVFPSPRKSSDSSPCDPEAKPVFTVTSEAFRPPVPRASLNSCSAQSGPSAFQEAPALRLCPTPVPLPEMPPSSLRCRPAPQASAPPSSTLSHSTLTF